MKNNEISFVIQGPICPEVTKLSIDNLRQYFPESVVILSTWEGQDIEGLEPDVTLFSQDPGSTVFVYSRKNDPISINTNRQIVSTLVGLKSVKTKFAVKLRADNVLTKNTIVDLFDSFNEREPKYSIFNRRIITSNFFAKEEARGLALPYFHSDFFQFGETEDLITLWDVPLLQDYEFNENLKGKKQHANFPNDSVHVEQELWTRFLNKFVDTKLFDEHGTQDDLKKSRNYMINNMVIVDGKTLGLEVPKRLQQGDEYPFHYYTYERWQWMYEREYNVSLGVSNSFKVKWVAASSYKFVRKGLRLKIRKSFFKLFPTLR